ncbi:hypothetical protein LCGC14_1858040 [marine sediment metagenome]|uniref:Uncharacterized protein n=1 Tax=marine sediment metagenome TaxID=412755 RepID=A0A0F9G8Q1_9ZZZZ
MKTYIVIYNAETDFYRVETEHPDTIITDIIKEGYAQEDIEVYEAKRIGLEVTIDNVTIKLDEHN